jgi:hypothetical protein
MAPLGAGGSNVPPPPNMGGTARARGGRAGDDECGEAYAEGGSVRFKKPKSKAFSEAADMPQPARQPEDVLPMRQERPEQAIATASAQKGMGDEDEGDLGMKRGGRAGMGPGRVPGIDAGAGSGEGRLEKSKHLDYCAGGRG